VADGITAFLTARLGEDEAAAKAVAGRSRFVVVDEDVCRYIARHDPARVLREVEAKRKILALHKIDSEPETVHILHHDKKWNTGWEETKETGRLSYWCAVCDHDRDYGHIGGPNEGCETLRALAAVWSNHPDYNPDWAVG
jgi:hypothetical protein